MTIAFSSSSSSSASFSLDDDARLAAARARVLSARALLDRGDPAGRALLEDAGAIYEELGDHDAVLAIDRELRAIQADLEESPRSFHATPPPPPPSRPS